MEDSDGGLGLQQSTVTSADCLRAPTKVAHHDLQRLER